jgi:hypothetical protein
LYFKIEFTMEEIPLTFFFESKLGEVIRIFI